MRRALVGLVASVLGGCSLIFNPNNLPDPRMIDAALLDSNPCALDLVSVSPPEILEGQGAAGSAPAVVVVHGNNIVNTNLRIALAATDGTTVRLDPVTDIAVSADTTMLAFRVVAQVDETRGAPAADIPLDIAVTQDAPPGTSCTGAATRTLSGKLMLRALPELTSGQGTSQLYSMIDLPAPSFTGTAPVQLNAVSSISLGNLTLSANGTTPGPGAFPVAGDAGTGVGEGGGPSVGVGDGGGGGGAGFAISGATGADNAGKGGAGGHSTGDPRILSITGNLASAGGGGGKGLTAVGGIAPAGGVGGAGGGAIVLTAGGNVKTGTVTSIGGAGGKGANALIANGGGGGGGAGGTVVIRSSYGALTLGPVSVAGGGGGSPGGGAGAAGRVRWDSPNFGDTGPASDSPPHQGPGFLAPAAIATTRQPTFTVLGTPGDEFDVRILDEQSLPHPGPHVAINEQGMAAVLPMLSAGYNQLCIKLANGLETDALANECIGVAYIP
jgi:hypothetical protein